MTEVGIKMPKHLHVATMCMNVLYGYYYIQYELITLQLIIYILVVGSLTTITTITMQA